MKIKIPRDQVEIQDIVHIKEEPTDNDIKDHDTGITSETLASDQKPILFVENAGENNMNTVAFEGESDPLSVDIKINVSDSLHKYKTKSVEKHAFICHVCEAEFQCKPDLMLHISSEHVKNEDTDTCSKANDEAHSTSPKTLKTNRYQPDTQRTRKDQIANIQTQIKRKNRKERDSNSFKCLCKRTFTSKGFLRTHLARSHLGWFVCNFCEKIFTSNKELNKHSLDIHSQAVYACSKCCKVYTSPTYLKSHFKVCKKKDKDKVHVNCDECGKYFQTKITMEVHLNTHMGIGHQCTECSETFLHLKTMHRHRLVKHYGKGLNCELCSKTFSDKRDLNRHMRHTHKSEKAQHMKCNILGKSFKCDSCEKTFSVKCDLYFHMKRKHNLEQFSCALCGMPFKRKDSISDHIRCIHTRCGY